MAPSAVRSDDSAPSTPVADLGSPTSDIESPASPLDAPIDAPLPSHLNGGSNGAANGHGGANGVNGSNGVNGANGANGASYANGSAEVPAAEEEEPTPEPKFEPVAIVGMACRLPGGVSDPEEFYQLCVRGRSGWMEMPEERFSKAGYHHPNPDKLGCYNPAGACFLSEDVSLFDAPLFQTSPSGRPSRWIPSTA